MKEVTPIISGGSDFAGGTVLYVNRRAHSPTGVRGYGKRLLSGCVTSVSEPHLLEPPGLFLSEEQIPQAVANLRSWRSAMETLEPMLVLHTQEVWGSSPRAPTICPYRKLRSV